MPGRHSGGSGLGGGGLGGGMRGGGLGGGYRGGGFGGFGGGMRGGPGWGGGWRGWGGWRWRGLGPFGWGWFMPWTWFGWGGGYGVGLGGLGCLMLLIVAGIMVMIFVVSSMGLGGGGYGYRGGYNNYPNNGVSASGSASGGASLANESPAIQTQTAQDLTELHAAFDSRIAAWQTQVSDNQNLSIPPADAGLTQDNNTQAVLYGKCGRALYIYVIDKTRPDTGPANGEGYVYTTASSPGACHPPQWTVYASEAVGGSWYFATLESVN